MKLRFSKFSVAIVSFLLFCLQSSVSLMTSANGSIKVYNGPIKLKGPSGRFILSTWAKVQTLGCAYTIEIPFLLPYCSSYNLYLQINRFGAPQQFAWEECDQALAYCWNWEILVFFVLLPCIISSWDVKIGVMLHKTSVPYSSPLWIFMITLWCLSSKANCWRGNLYN